MVIVRVIMSRIPPTTNISYPLQDVLDYRPCFVMCKIIEVTLAAAAVWDSVCLFPSPASSAPVCLQLIFLCLYNTGLSTTSVPDCSVTDGECNGAQVTSSVNFVATRLVFFGSRLMLVLFSFLRVENFQHLSA